MCSRNLETAETTTSQPVDWNCNENFYNWWNSHTAFRVQDYCMAILGLTWPATLKRFLPSQGIGMISQVQVKVLKIQVNWSTFLSRRSPGASSSCLGWGILASGRSRQPPSQATSFSDFRGCVSELHQDIERSHFINYLNWKFTAQWFPPFWKATRRQLFPF